MKSLVAALGAGLLAAGAAHAADEPAKAADVDPAAAAADEQSTDQSLSGVIIYGRAEQRIGKAEAATEGAVAGADLSVRPILRTGELLESVPGMMVTQHSGSGKANQYFLRGFNLDHGTDFGMTLDGVPMNFRTHGHGQGYLDINGLIPEIVGRIDYRKGPYRADYGDFNLVGGAQITTKSHVDAPELTLEAGAFDWKRAVGVGSFNALGGDNLLAFELKTYDGPWALPEHTRHMSFYGKHTRETKLGTLSVSFSSYNNSWNPTEQIPERAIGTLIPDAYGSLDPYLHGRTEREILAANLDGEHWRGSLYVQHYNWAMISNYTFYLENPVTGDELDQVEKLWTYGGRLQRTWQASDKLNFVTGGEFRYDDIPLVALYHTSQGAIDSTTNAFNVDEASAALYGEATYKPTDKLSLFAGLRGDAYNFKAKPLGGAAWSGDETATMVSPKVGLSYLVADGIALYANYGEGFHSNDARGVTNPLSPSPGLVKGKGAELGIRYERHNTVLTGSLWGMDSGSELLYVGDSGSVEPSDPSRRYGVEVTAFWRPIQGLAIDGVATWSHARFRNAPGAEYIPGALETSGEVGASYIQPKWNVSARVRYVGAHPLTEDNVHRSEPTTLVNLRAAWTPGPVELYAEVLNVFDTDKKDIEYYYESYLPAIDTSGPVEDVHSRAVEPRMLRVGIKKRF